MTTKVKVRTYRQTPGQPLADSLPRTLPPRPSSAAHQPSTAPSTCNADIQAEGLSNRQLRTAWRLARRNGLNPDTDIDAVRLLRERGIDPFGRSAILGVTTGKAPDGTAPRIQLPARHVAATVPAKTAPDAVADSASMIRSIQQDIRRRRKRKVRGMGLRVAAFILLPTLLAAWYFHEVATPMFATRSEFVIQQADAAPAPGLGGLFQGTGLAVQQDSTTVQSYLQSRDAMLRLDRDLGFKAHFNQPWIDPLQRLASDATNEEAFRLYRRHVTVGFDPTEGILKLEVTAADPDTSTAFAKALIAYAEEQVDALTRRLREDQMAGAQQSYDTAERRALEAQHRVLELQEELGVLDPASETGSLMQQITAFEIQLRERQLELTRLKANERPNTARVDAAQADIDELRGVVADLRHRMTDTVSGRASLARIAGELRIAEAELTTRQLLLQQAAEQLESARIDANRQVRYMAVGVSPVSPDEAAYPRVIQNTLLAFAVAAGIFLMVSLTASVLREQVTT